VLYPLQLLAASSELPDGARLPPIYSAYRDSMHRVSARAQAALANPPMTICRVQTIVVCYMPNFVRSVENGGRADTYSVLSI